MVFDLVWGAVVDGRNIYGMYGEAMHRARHRRHLVFGNSEGPDPLKEHARGLCFQPWRLITMPKATAKNPAWLTVLPGSSDDTPSGGSPALAMLESDTH